MPDPERLYDTDGNVYRQDFTRDYVPSREGGLWPERDVGLLGPNIERDAGGNPKVARDWAQRPRRTRDGRPLFVPRMSAGSPGNSAEEFGWWIAKVVIITMVAIAAVGLFILWRFLQSLWFDIQERRLTPGTLAWGIPVAVVLVAAIVTSLTPRSSVHTVTGNSSARNRGDRAASTSSMARERLRSMIPAELRGRCVSLSPSEMDVDVVGSIAAYECDPDDPLVDDIGFYLFADVQTLREWWQTRLSRIDKPMAPGDCRGGDNEWGTWSNGSVACYAAVANTRRVTGRVRWTDEGRLVYGSLDLDRNGIGTATNWWREHLIQ